MGEENMSQNKQDRMSWRMSTMETSAEAALLFLWVCHSLIYLATKPHTHTAACPLPHHQDGGENQKSNSQKTLGL